MIAGRAWSGFSLRNTPLDAMQIAPAFAYLMPVVILFFGGAVAAAAP